MTQRTSMLAGILLGLAFGLGSTSGRAQVADPVVQMTADAAAPSHAFPHFWEQMFGSGRAALSLRDSYRQDLKRVKGVTEFHYVRFHAIFHDELGVYEEDGAGQPRYNFSYIDQIYDGLLAQGVRPFVELSFMPSKLAVRPQLHPFWYHPTIAPPKSYARWDALITAFAQHLVNRYGADEVRQWYFEVWNEPNLDFWGGKPRQSSYWQLYDHTARALKAVDPQLRVGGPATAQAAWISEFIAHTVQAGVPVDFVSSHVYGNDDGRAVLGAREPVARNEMVCRAIAKVHDEIKRSSLPGLPLIWSEFNASYKNEPEVTDSVYMGPWLADTIRQCDGMVDLMSYWTFSDVFEEQGVVRKPFYGGYGLIAEDGIPKPAFNAFALLHRLGPQRFDIDSDSALLTRRADGTWVLALWNYAPPAASGPSRTVTVKLRGIEARSAQVYRLDSQHGDVGGTYASMHSPTYPTAAQIQTLQTAAELPPADTVPIDHESLTLTLPAYGLALLEITPQ